MLLYVSAVWLLSVHFSKLASLDSIVTQDICGHPERTSKFFNSSNNMECRMILIIFSLYPFWVMVEDLPL
jgi:hypothetical protein